MGTDLRLHAEARQLARESGKSPGRQAFELRVDEAVLR
jgi:hypothetical protein